MEVVHNGVGTAVENSTVCLFPALRSVDVQRIRFEDTVCRALLNLPCPSKRDIHVPLAAVWATVLRHFAEVDEAQFAVVREGMPEQVFSAAVTPMTPVSTLFEPRSWNVRSWSREDIRRFNTGIFVVLTRNGGRLARDSPPYDVNLFLRTDSTGVELSLVYRLRALSETYARHLVSGISSSILSIFRHPTQLLHEVDFCCSLQLQQILSWQHNEPRQPTRTFLFQYIQHQALVQGEAVAVDAWDGRFTYKELDATSSQMADHFRRHGIEGSVMVPVCFEKSRWAIAAMLAVNKVGAAFVPCDPSYPQKRLGDICNKIGASVALVSPKTEPIFAALGVSTIVISSTFLHNITQDDEIKHPTSPDVRGVSYCLFTSGTTGEPKGCIVSHRALASISEHVDDLHLNERSRSLQFASFSFGASLVEIWCTLIAGGTLCIPSDTDRLNSLGEFMAGMRINWAFLTPTVLESLSPEKVPSLHLFIAGEPIGERDIARWRSKAKLFQAYGLTEWAGIFAVSKPITSIESRRGIGFPVNGQAWVVSPSDHTRIMPIGAVGELLIGGPSLADGYKDDPERTDSVFVSWPSSAGCTRLYKTGDMARYAEDGSIEYMRRKDIQVTKIRGQRLDAGEVEYHIRQLVPAARRVVVMVHEPSSHQRTLVAVIHLCSTGNDKMSPALPRGGLQFLEPNSKYVALAQDLDEGLRKSLPRFMIPQLFLPVIGMPTTVTGKVDRQTIYHQLNQLSYDDLRRLAGLTVKAQAPQTQLEEIVLQSVSEVLGLEPGRLGMLDNFFHVGGSSATAIKVAASMKKHKLDVAVTDIFDNPVLVDLAAAASRRDRLKQSKSRTLELLDSNTLNELKKVAVVQCRLDESQIEDIYPATALQAGQIAMTVNRPRLCKALIKCGLRPETDLEAFKGAWERVVQLNGILRTRFIVCPSRGTFQVVTKAAFEWDSAEDMATCIHKCGLLEKRIGDKLVHAYIVPGEAEKRHPTFSFALIMHHALCDQWSVRVLMDQLTAIYKNQSVSPVPFTPFLKYLADKQSTFKEYWTRQFDGLETVPFPALPSPNYVPVATEELKYSMALPGREIKSYTMATYLKLAWGMVLWHHTGSADVVFGVTVNGRAAGVDNIGKMTVPTIATIPQRLKLSSKEAVAKQLSEVQLQSMKVVPFEQAGLHNIQKYSVEAKTACMFQSQLIIQPPQNDPPELFTSIEFAATAIGGFSAYGLAIEFLTGKDDRSCLARVTFDPNMVSRSGVQRLMESVETVLQQLMKDPGQTLGNIRTISPQDWAKLQQWNGTVAPDSNQCIHDVVHDQYLRSPDAPAVSVSNGEMTYAQLIDRSNKLAMELLRRQISPGTYIPLLFEKSKWTIVAMLAVLKVGAAFVLLDPSYPLQRLRDIHQEIESQIMICSEAQSRTASKITEQIIAVQDVTDIWQNETASQGFPVVQPTDPAYVVFTSGSTGAPKGIIISHQAYCSSAAAHNRAHGTDRFSRVLQFAKYAFDVSIMEMLSTLMAGGCVCVLDDLERQDTLADSIRERAVTHAFLTPSSARLLKHCDLPSLRVIVMGGEVMSPADSSYWVHKVQLMNEYGNAECCVASTLRKITKPDGHLNDIGFPMGVAAWVTDPADHNRLVPVGAVGELLIEGPSIAQGYLNNPEATARAFIDPPDWLLALRQAKTTRVYKTGDLVQYNDDGSLLFLGRKDAQIKIRGQRLELDEVEYHIRRFTEGLEVATVVAAPLKSQTAPCLAAFIVQTQANGELNGQQSSHTPIVSATDDFRRLSSALQNELYSVLPDYMVPSIYLPVTHMPKTASGKLDRTRLKEVIEQHTWVELMSFGVSTISKKAPSTIIERKLQATWAQVLGIPPDSVGVNDSFYHLGGDSISAMQVVAQVRSKGLEHSTHDIMRLKTIAAIANKVGVASTSQTVIREEATDELFDLSPIQAFFFDKYPQGTNRFNQNMLIHIQQRVSTADVERAATRLVQHHSMLRARYVQQENGTWKQFLANYTKDCFSFQSHLVSSEQEMRRIIEASQASLDIRLGPVFTVDLFELGGKQCLFMIAHHLVIDLVSWRIILADIEAMIRDSQHELDPAMSFQAWSRLQAAYAHSHLEPADVSLLPCNDDGATQKFWGVADNPDLLGDTENKHICLDEQTTDAIFRASSNALGVEPVELLHAALLFSFVQTFPHRHAPCIYGEAHGREPWDPSIDITRTVGWFTTLWPVVVQIEASDDLQTVVQKVKDARRRMTNNGWDYFTSIYQNTQRERQRPSLPAIEITFNYAGKFQQVERADALLRMEPMSKQSLFDGAKELKRWAMFEINSVILGGCLEFHLTYNASLIIVVGVWWMPESPRWLMNKGRHEEALEILVKYHAEGDHNDEFVQLEYSEIEAAIALDKEIGHTGWADFLRSKGNRKRIALITALGLFSQWSGNGLISYYLKYVMDSVGTKDAQTQFVINAGRKTEGLVVNFVFAFFIDIRGRRPVYLVSTVGTFVVFNAWTIVSARYEIAPNKALGYAFVFLTFLYGIFYDIKSGLMSNYTTEILPYGLQAKGFTWLNFCVTGALFFNQYINAIALDALAWKYYIVYCVFWDSKCS
ncbi:hypothetical protein CFD26_105622 [Aspergillus turcosus]|uniref:Nonribosomal peptide synthetases (NRPS) n=1 Tax=Aspergillus turcosus TaxID=1245748 RepID=A0A3R7IJ62_9EURO|nr:hypothetical protein CFD26_105622 [Aspergillus turcosus]